MQRANAVILTGIESCTTGVAMSYRHILLHLDAGAACTLRINATLDLASRMDAHVTGLATISVAPLYYYPKNAMAGQIVAEWQSQLEQQARTVTARFETAARAHGYTGVETRIDNYNELGALTINARSADLLVMRAYGHSRAREWVFGDVTRTILSSMTIPVLMSH